MKPLLALACALALSLTATADDRLTFLKTGDRLRLQTSAPLLDQASEVTVVEVGPESWILVEYQRTFLKPGESGAKTEAAQMWVNFEHVIAFKKLAK